VAVARASTAPTCSRAAPALAGTHAGAGQALDLILADLPVSGERCQIVRFALAVLACEIARRANAEQVRQVDLLALAQMRLGIGDGDRRCDPCRAYYFDILVRRARLGLRRRLPCFGRAADKLVAGGCRCMGPFRSGDRGIHGFASDDAGTIPRREEAWNGSPAVRIETRDIAAAMRREGDLGARDIEQLDHGSGACREDDGVAGEPARIRVVAAQLPHEHMVDAVRPANGAGDHCLCQHGHALASELGATGKIARRLSRLDQRDDLPAGGESCLRELGRFDAGAEDRQRPAIEGIVALEQGACGGDAHHTGQLPAGKGEADIAAPGRDDRRIEGEEPAALAIAEPGDMTAQPAQTRSLREQAPDGNAEPDVDAGLEGFGDPRVGCGDGLDHPRLVAGGAAHALAEMVGDVEPHQRVIDRVLIDQHDRDTAPGGFERRRQAGRAGSDDQQTCVLTDGQRLAGRRPLIMAGHSGDLPAPSRQAAFQRRLRNG
jgi:hypothetical protein